VGAYFQQAKVHMRCCSVLFVAVVIVLTALCPAPLRLLAQQPTAGSASGVTPGLPTSDDAATALLKASPFHAEWVNVFVLPGHSPVRTYIVHPVRATLGSVVIVVSDERGMTDRMRAVGHQLALAGYTAMVPDLLSDAGASDRSTEAVRRLQATWNYGTRLPAVNGKVAAVGFGSGAGGAMAFAAAQPALAATVTFDGQSEAAKGSSPVLHVSVADPQAWTTTLAFLKQHAE
jgi:hypothetical protein